MGWLALLSLAKVAYYLGVVSFIGMNAMRLLLRHGRSNDLTVHADWHKPLLRAQWAGLFISLVGAAAVVPLSAGMLLNDGVSGIIDSLMLQISWQSSIGTQTQFRLLAIIMAMLCTAWGNKLYNGSNTSLAWVCSWLLTSALFAASFTFSGHTAEANWLAKLLVALHVLMAAWWLGSLYPLIRLCRLEDVELLRTQLHAYGNQAAVWVGLLLVSGAGLFALLLLNVRTEANNDYLFVMGCKLVPVAVMLGFAAYHKCYLVANLTLSEDRYKVRKSIVGEAFIGTLVIVITAILTSSFGIAH